MLPAALLLVRLTMAEGQMAERVHLQVKLGVDKPSSSKGKLMSVSWLGDTTTRQEYIGLVHGQDNGEDSAAGGNSGNGGNGLTAQAGYHDQDGLDGSNSNSGAA